MTEKTAALTMTTVEPEAFIRPLLIMAHLLAFALAAVGTALCDYAVMVKRRLDTRLLQESARVVSVALLALWFSGGAIVWLDTGFDAALIWAQPKLLAKLTVVALLTLNGLLLHRWVFPMLLAAARSRCLRSRLPASLGAVSAASWVYAVFLGVAAPVAPALGYAGFMLLYGASLAFSMGLALTMVHPRLVDRLAAHAAPSRTAGYPAARKPLRAT